MKDGRRWPPLAQSQQHRPGVLQPKASAPQVRRTPTAPPVYRPQPAPKVLQRKAAAPPHPPPVPVQPAAPAPGAFRPQTPLKVLQAKKVAGQQNAPQPPGPVLTRPPASRGPRGAVRPESGGTLQAKRQAAPPVSKPQPPHAGRAIQRFPGLNDMPNDLIDLIGSHLDVKSKVSLASTSKRFKTLSSPNVIGEVQETGQEHHPRYVFGPQESATAYPLDDWLMGKKDQEEAARFHKEVEGYKGRARKAVAIWDGTYSIIDPLVSLISSGMGIVLRTTSGKQPQPVTTYRIAHTFKESGGNMVCRLLAAKHTLGLRHRDLNQVPTSITIRYWDKKSVADSEYLGNIDWGGVLRCGRLEAKEKLLKGEPAPKNWQTLDVCKWMKNSNDPVLSKLFDDYKLLKKEDGREVTNTVTRQLPKNKSKKCPISIDWGKIELAKGEVTWNFSLGHIRFIVWTEWRVAEELL